LIVTVVVLGVVIVGLLATFIPVLVYLRRQIGRGPGPELEQALDRERRRADIAETELRVVRNRISSLESQLELPQGDSS
jgi:hypothetical protein